MHSMQNAEMHALWVAAHYLLMCDGEAWQGQTQLTPCFQ